LTNEEIKNKVINRFNEGQTVKLKINDDERKKQHEIMAVISKFYQNHISVQHNCYLESFTYFEFMRIAAPFNTKDAVIPDRLLR
jgi:uncharacterized protein Veg